MAEFFSRIFAIPSDVSSTESPHGASAAGGTGRKTRGGGRAHRRTMSSTDGGSYGEEGDEETFSYESDTFEDDDASESRSEDASSYTETVEEHPAAAVGEKKAGSRGGHRGRQRRNDRASGDCDRASSEQPLGRGRDGDRKRTSQQHRSSSMQLQVHSTSARKQRGSASRSRSRGAHQRLRSSFEENEGGTQQQKRHHSRQTKQQRSRSSSKNGGGGGWRTKFSGGMKKHLSPGTTASGTPPSHSKKGGSLRRRKGGEHPVGKGGRRAPQKSNNGRKLQHSPLKGKPPINVGDSITISQQFLEAGCEMSVLTMPRELAAMDEELVHSPVANGGVGRSGSGLGRNAEDEGVHAELAKMYANDRVQAFLARKQQASSTGGISSNNNSHRRNNSNASTLYDQQLHPKISEYASRFVTEGQVYHTYSQDNSAVSLGGDQEQGDKKEERGVTGKSESIVHDNGEDEIEVTSPASAGGNVDNKHLSSVDGYTPTSPGRSVRSGGIPSPPTPPPPPPPRWLLQVDLPPPHGRRSPRSPTTRGVTKVPHWDAPFNGQAKSSVASSQDDPPGEVALRKMAGNQTRTKAKSPTASPHTPKSTGVESQDPPSTSDLRGEDPDGHRPFDEDSGFLNSRTNPSQQQTPDNSRAKVTFSLPPPQVSSSSLSQPPAPPFMGPQADCYYSMERNTANPGWMLSPSSSQLLPPIIELWSVVESSDNVPGCDIISSADRWDVRREQRILGEDVPLDVSGDWIDVRNEEQNEGVLQHDTQAKEHSPYKEVEDSYTSERDTPDDEYFDDILNCGEDLSAMDLNPGRGSDVVDGLPSNGGEGSDDVNDSNANSVRHRSTWDRPYKPPNNAEEGHPLVASPSSRSSADNWQRLVRHRSGAATIIQRAVRGLIERQRVRALLESVMVIQPLVRTYLTRKRYLSYLNLKRSYHPKRWMLINEGVAYDLNLKQCYMLDV